MSTDAMVRDNVYQRRGCVMARETAGGDDEEDCGLLMLLVSLFYIMDKLQ